MRLAFRGTKTLLIRFGVCSQWQLQIPQRYGQRFQEHAAGILYKAEDFKGGLLPRRILWNLCFAELHQCTFAFYRCSIRNEAAE